MTIKRNLKLCNFNPLIQVYTTIKLFLSYMNFDNVKPRFYLYTGFTVEETFHSFTSKFEIFYIDCHKSLLIEVQPKAKTTLNRITTTLRNRLGPGETRIHCPFLPRSLSPGRSGLGTPSHNK